MFLGAVNSEYNLLGAMSEQEFINGLDTADTETKRALHRKFKQANGGGGGQSRGSRAEFEKRISMLPGDIQRALANQAMQASDSKYYSVKDISQSKIVKMFRDDDNKTVGYGNISSAKLEKGNYFLLDKIQILYGVADQGETTPYKVNFNSLPDFIRNGEFELKANGTVLIPMTSAEAFFTDGDQRLVKGTLVLDNPKLIRDQQTIELNFEWASNAPDRAYMKAILHGTSVIKA